MSRIRNYVRATLYLLMYCMPASWALRLMMQIATVRSARDPKGQWPLEAVRWAIPDLKAAWRRRMFVGAHETWQLITGPRLGAAGVCRHLTVLGIEHVRDAVRSGDGAIVILAHQVGLHAVGWALMEAGLPWSDVALAREAPRHWAERLCTRDARHIRAFGAQTLLRSDTAGIRQAYRRLRNGEVVCMPQDLPGDRYRVRLLHRDASLALGSVRMAMATGARLIPCSVAPADRNGLQVCFGSPIDTAGGEGKLAETVTRALKDVILSAPELWWTEFVFPDPQRDRGSDAAR